MPSSHRSSDRRAPLPKRTTEPPSASRVAQPVARMLAVQSASGNAAAAHLIQRKLGLELEADAWHSWRPSKPVPASPPSVRAARAARVDERRNASPGAPRNAEAQRDDRLSAMLAGCVTQRPHARTLQRQWVLSLVTHRLPAMPERGKELIDPRRWRLTPYWQYHHGSCCLQQSIPRRRLHMRRLTPSRG